MYNCIVNAKNSRIKIDKLNDRFFRITKCKFHHIEKANGKIREFGTARKTYVNKINSGSFFYGILIYAVRLNVFHGISERILNKINYECFSGELKRIATKWFTSFTKNTFQFPSVCMHK